MGAEKNKNKAFAAVDLGSSSCRLLIVDDGGKVLCSRQFSTKLAEGMYAKNKLTDEAIKRGLEAFKCIADECKNFGNVKVRAVATAACRMAENAQLFIKLVKQTSGIDIEIIDEVEEAKLNLKGASAHVKGKSKYVLVYDLGGASTEITLATNDDKLNILGTISIPLGARIATEKFNLLEYDAENARKLQNVIADYVKKFVQKTNFEKYQPDTVCVATSSIPLRLGALIAQDNCYEREIYDGRILQASDMDKVIADVYKTTYAERLQNPCIGESRAGIFIAGCIIFKTIYDELKIKLLTASLKSAKDGIAEELREQNG